MAILAMLIAAVALAMVTFEIYCLNELCRDIKDVRVEVEKLKNEKVINEARMYGVTTALDILFVKMNHVEQHKDNLFH